MEIKVFDTRYRQYSFITIQEKDVATGLQFRETFKRKEKMKFSEKLKRKYKHLVKDNIMCNRGFYETCLKKCDNEKKNN